MSNPYGVLLLKESLTISFFGPGIGSDMKLSWADGQIGAIPVFNTKEEALAYAKGDESLVFELKIVT